jgi:hypothetical protein
VLKLFLPEATLEEWAVEAKADLQGAQLVIAEDKTVVPLTPAVHFSKLVSGSDDKHLLSKVKSAAQLQSLGAEQMRESVIVGETAYEVVSGYIAEMQDSAGGAEGAPQSEGTSEAEQLAAFLLDKLT